MASADRIIQSFLNNVDNISSNFLDLGNCGLERIPDELLLCITLEGLNLGVSYPSHDNEVFKKSANRGKRNTLSAFELKKLSALPKLKSLYLNDNDLVDTSFLSSLSNLSSLSLKKNHISKLDLVRQHPSLSYLNLSNNRLTDVSTIHHLNGLEILFIDSNELENMDGIETLPSLRYLDLSKNKIERICQFLFGGHLETLLLNSNRINSLNNLKYLKSLKTLSLSSNAISDIFPLVDLQQIEVLNLSNNDIENLDFLVELDNLIKLDLSGNRVYSSEFHIHSKHGGVDRRVQISQLQAISSKKLKELNLNNTGVSDFSFLYKLKNLRALRIANTSPYFVEHIEELGQLEYLDISQNSVSDLFFLKNLPSLEKLTADSNSITLLDPLLFTPRLKVLSLSQNNILTTQAIQNLKDLEELNLAKNALNHLFGLEDCRNLKILNVSENDLIDISELAHCKNLEYLDICKTTVYDYSFLQQNSKLKTLNLSFNKFTDFEILTKLPNLQRLVLRKANIDSISWIKNLDNLRHLNLAENKIENLKDLENLTKLQTLNLSFNIVRDLSSLTNLNSLKSLDLSYNHIWSIEDIAPIQYLLKRNNFSFKVDDNPFVEKELITLKSNSNHRESVLNVFLRSIESKKQKINLPVKILLLGNHGAGKSSLLQYLKSNKVLNHQNSTHIIKIQSYNIEDQTNVPFNIPDAIFFDFGGQDYYHGIYNAFISSGAIQILLWRTSSNVNQTRFKDSNGIATRDFDLSYWIAQKERYENEKFNGIVSPLILVQTHADTDSKLFLNHTDHVNHGLKNDFYLSLIEIPSNDNKYEEYESGRKHFKATLNNMIKAERSEREEPLWYIDFLKHILSKRETASHNAVFLSELYPFYKRPERAFIKDDLEQLHQQGIVLYYGDSMPEIVWLNPEALVTYVHNSILDKNVLLKNKGIITSKSSIAPEILNMLIEQKVIFCLNDGDEEKLIVPSYSPLACEDENFKLISFSTQTLCFKLKFKRFMPIGLINQLICWFGSFSELKRFWRDQLIFDFHGKLILVSINTELLTLSLHANSRLDQNEIAYLFYSLIALYWDTPPLKFNDYRSFKDSSKIDSDDEGIDDKLYMADRIYYNDACQPKDLYISINGTDFISYRSFCSLEHTQNKIRSFVLDENELSLSSSKEIDASIFQPFTLKKMKKMKKIFISYSKKDLKLVDEFLVHLAPLKRSGLVDSWYCTELLAGEVWDEKIQKEFDSSDIICFMVSPNFLANSYIYEYEQKKAINRYQNNGDIKIIPIIMQFCMWQVGESNLSRFTALPYTAKPVTDFVDRNTAWYIISACIKLVIEIDHLDPIGPDFYREQLPPDIRDLFERIISRGLDVNTNYGPK